MIPDTSAERKEVAIATTLRVLLNRRTGTVQVRGVTRYLVRWRGHESADDKWLRLEELAHCPVRVAEYDAAAPGRRHATQRDAAAPAAAPPQAPAPLTAPIGFRLADSAEAVTGSALVGRTVLFRWPTEGWVGGTVGRRSRAAGFSHLRLVRHRPRSALGAAVVASLLDAASHGPAGRWVLLCPVREPGPAVTLTGDDRHGPSGRAARAGPIEIFHNGIATRDPCVCVSCA
jgi:hypothetical protein